MDNAILLGKKWLLESGIQGETGGFKSWFDLEQEKYPYVYSEITGYGITTLLFLNKFFKGDFLDRARAAADWVINNAIHECGGVKTRDYIFEMVESGSYSFESANLYAFDNGMVLYGIINLYKEHNEKKYLEIAEKIADFMIDKMRKPDGLFYAVYNPDTAEQVDSPEKWSSQSGSYHAKLALGFTDLYEVTKQDKYKNTVISLCEASLGFQDPSGRFITSRKDQSTHLHPHSYSAEGLLYAGIHFDRKDFIGSAQKATMWALNGQRKDGGIPKKYDGSAFIELYRSDILAQTLRLAILLKELKKNEVDLFSLRQKLVEFQYNTEGPQNGGFYYGFTLDGKRRKHINSWCSMFAIQSLIMFEDVYINENGSNKMEYFV